MKYFYIFFLFVFAGQTMSSQNSKLWKGYFSYKSIKDVSYSADTFFAASENAVFSKNNSTNEIKTTNTVDGLPGQSISAMYHSASANKTLLGYENGLIIVINETDHTILNVVDIINKQISPTIKKVNHFMEHEGILYISCDFGIVQYNLNTLQFGDTYFIGTGTGEIVVNQTAFLNGYIYAATLTEGIKKADIANPQLIDATQWSTIVSGSFSGVESFEDNLFAATTTGQITRSSNGISFSGFTSVGPIVDIRAGEDYLIITTASSVYFYNSTFALITQINSGQITVDTGEPVLFTCAAAVGNTFYLGTAENGVISSPINNPLAFTFISPDGPLRNNIFSINAQSSNLWAVFGAYDFNYNPYPLRTYGISKFTKDGWLNIPYNTIKTAIGTDVVDLVSVTVNPADENQVYISSFHSGLLKLENDVPTILYNQTNSGLETPVGDNTLRVGKTAFDKSGNLWVITSIIKNGLKVLKTNGQWQSYNLENYFLEVGKFNIGDLVIDKNGTKWMGTRDDGVIGFNEAQDIYKTLVNKPEAGNLPSPTGKTLAIDNRNQLWIGTTNGLRVLSSIDSFISESDINTNPIIIIEEDLAQELLYTQYITDIKVDGANNKWIGTADAGVFLFSSNGQETIHHFTTDNSPLPSNSINDIDINAATGEVFFATTRGMVSYKGTALEASDDLSNVIVYPNPVRPGYTGTVKITGLLNKANIKITDIEGNLVYEVYSEGGSIEWDTRAFGKYKVASGVYMIFISAEDGVETKVKKVMIIR